MPVVPRARQQPWGDGVTCFTETPRIAPRSDRDWAQRVNMLPKRKRGEASEMETLCSGNGVTPAWRRPRPGSTGRSGPASLVFPLPADELLDGASGLVVAVLLGRRLHEIARRRQDRTTDSAVLRELRRPHGVDDDPRGVRRVPDLELVLEVERHVAERPALEPYVGPLAVVEPRDVVRRPDVHVRPAEVAVDLRRDGLCLGDLLRLQALELLHVQEVHVPAHVELHRAVELDSAVLEQ